jgi:NTE family protein
MRQAGGRTALVLQGGGARGGYQVGVIKALAEIAGRRRLPFQIICGASVGSINAAAVAMAAHDFPAGARHIEDLWLSLRCNTIYDTRALTLLGSSLRWAGTLVLGHFGLRSRGGLLNAAPLAALLQREFSAALLQRAIRSGALDALCITASGFAEGNAMTFFDGAEGIADWARARRRGVRVAMTADHLLASAALPFAFAPVRIGTGYYLDGSMRLTSPLSPAIHTGATRILVISTRDGVPDRLPATAPEPPSIGEMAAYALDIMFNDNLEADTERMLRINNTVSLLPPEAREKTPLKVIETLMLNPSQDIRPIAKRHRGSLPRAMRILMRSLGVMGGDGRMESYLMFEPEYVSDLIALGYGDTMARRDEVAGFLAGG